MLVPDLEVRQRTHNFPCICLNKSGDGPSGRGVGSLDGLAVVVSLDDLAGASGDMARVEGRYGDHCGAGAGDGPVPAIKTIAPSAHLI